VNTIGDGRAGELAEETGLEAPQWPSLVDLPPSPTMSTEVCRMYQAQQLPRRRRSGHAEGEESYLQFRWPTLPMLSVVDTRRPDHQRRPRLAAAGLLAAAVPLGRE
jgi:8-oxo-dGTP pyrophosphatase MutT (NUDIX family)